MTSSVVVGGGTRPPAREVGFHEELCFLHEESHVFLHEENMFVHEDFLFLHEERFILLEEMHHSSLFMKYSGFLYEGTCIFDEE